MDELMPMDEIRKEIKEIKRVETPVVQFAETPAVPSVAETTMQHIVGQAVVHQMSNDDTKQRVLKTADKVIKTQISQIENQVEQGEKEAVFSNNKDACDLYGIDEKTVPKWVVNVAKLVQNFWYFVWLIAGAATIAPIVFLGKKIKVVIKKTWIAMLFSVLIYAAILVTPFLVKLIKGELQ